FGFVGSRRESRLAVVAKDAAACFGKDSGRMKSVPGAAATGSQLATASNFARITDPVATAPGTDCLSRRSFIPFLSFVLCRFSFSCSCFSGCRRRRGFHFFWGVWVPAWRGRHFWSWRRGQRSVFKLRSGPGVWIRIGVLVGLGFFCVRFHLGAFQSQLALALLVHLLHILGHRRRLRKIFLRLVLQEI